MKLQTKTLPLIYILILAIGTILSLYIPKNEVTASEAIIIPKEAIRLRILANSDSQADQALKRLVRDEVNANITNWVQELTDINEARELIESKQPEIQKIAENVLAKQGSNQTVKINFGKVQFPTKLYGQFLYPAGEYEAILITLGEGKGANWWCVLFPPLCFLDFSNGVAVGPGFEEEEAPVTPVVESPVVTEAPQVTEVTEQQPIKVVENVEKTAVQPVITELPAQQTSSPVVPTEAKAEPVYVAEKEEKVEVKFFLKELWLKIF